VDQTTPKIGQLLDGTKGRDAIHMAMAPVEATGKLLPGQPIGILTTRIA